MNSRQEHASMSHPDHPLTRRHWLQLAGLGAAAALGGRLGRAQAQTTGYKALVCVFLYGGNDGMNAIVPTDTTRHGQYAGVRGALAIPRASLVPLAGTAFGLHPSLAALGTAWTDGHLAPVFNVGPLYAPMTKAQFLAAPANSALIPDNLFSHSDQQNLWETGTTDALTRTGWGGRAAQALATTNPVISVGGNGRFGLSALNAPLVLPGPGSNFGAYELGQEPWRLGYAPTVARATALRALYNQVQPTDLGNAYAKQQRDAFAVSERLAALVKTLPGEAGAVAGIDAAFAPLIAGGRLTTPLANQLYQIAKLVAGRGTVQGSRQLFFAQMGGFDTHGNQIGASAVEGEHARLLRQLGDAMACFYAAMKNLGLSDAVTLFTQSDFGRTFAPNNSGGTDHAWGNHHLVLGGAVKGRTTYGSYPQLVLGGANDVGVESWELQGRWIPTTSVDQYAATMLGWFGATEAQLDAVLPNLRNFGTQRRLAFL